MNTKQELEELKYLRQKVEEQDSIIKNHELIWKSSPKIVRKTFTPTQINEIFAIVENDSTLYLKNQWGDFIKKRDKCLLALSYLLSLRPREACSLRFTDIDHQNLIVHIQPNTNKTRKGGTVPLPPSAKHFIDEYLNQPAFFWQNSQYLFPSFADRSRPLSSERWKARFRNILKSAGIWQPCSVSKTHPPYSAYSLRHTKLSEVLAETKNLQLTSNIARHADIRSTKTYLSNYTVSKSYFELMRDALSKTGGLKENFKE